MSWLTKVTGQDGKDDPGDGKKGTSIGPIKVGTMDVLSNLKTVLNPIVKTSAALDPTGILGGPGIQGGGQKFIGSAASPPGQIVNDYKNDSTFAGQLARKGVDVATLGAAAPGDKDIQAAAQKTSQGYAKSVTDKTTAAYRHLEDTAPGVWKHIQDLATLAGKSVQDYLKGGFAGGGGGLPGGGIAGTGISAIGDAPGKALTVQGAPKSYQSAHIAGTQDPRVAMLQGMDNNAMQGYQNTLAQQLAQRASGQGPSMANMQGQQALAQSQANMYSQIASQRNAVNNPFAARSAMQAQSQQAAQINRDTMQGRLGEQQSAQAALGNLSTAARGQDIQVAQDNATFQAQANLAEYQGELQRAVAQGQLDQQTASSMFEQANVNARANLQAGVDFQKIKENYMALGLDAQKAAALAALQAQKNAMEANAQADARAGGMFNATGQLVNGVMGMFTGSGTPAQPTQPTQPTSDNVATNALAQPAPSSYGTKYGSYA